MVVSFTKIGIIGRYRTPGALDALIALKDFLLTKKVDLIVEANTAEAMGDARLKTVVLENFGENCELIIVVGGDGSLLNAARAVVDSGVPVLGINRGRLGFLTDILPNELQTKVEEVLEGKYDLEERFLLESYVIREDKIMTTGCALNEVVLYAGDVARMIEFEVQVDNQFLYSQRSDGLIVATPTGSTAYALSGGGPILHPCLQAIVMVPMFPHTLTSRPIVIDSNSVVELSVPNDLEIYPGVSCDGQAPIMLSSGDKVRIKQKQKKLKLLHPKGHSFYETLRAKLRWGTKWETRL